MKMTQRKMGGFSVWLAGILCLTISCGVLAEEMSDFEKLLRDAIRSNQEGQAADSANGGAADKRDSTPLVPDPKSVKPVEREAQKLAAQPTKMENTGKSVEKKAVKNDDGGWTAVTPNVKPVEPEAKAGEAVLVAEASMPSETKPGVSVWDTVPEVVEPGDKTAAMPKAESGSVWDVVADEDVAKAPLDWNAAAAEPEPPALVAENTLPWIVTPEKTAEAPKVEAAKKDEPKDEDVKVAEEAKETEPEAVEPKSTEPKPLIVKKEEPKAEEKKAEEKVQEKKTEKPKTSAKSVPESTSPADMSTILKALEKDDKKEEKKEVVKKSEEKKPTEAGKKEEAGPKVELKAEPKAEEAVAEKKPVETKPAAPVKVLVRDLPEPTFPDFDADTDETKYKLVDANRVGDLHAKDKIRLMYDEIMNGLKARNISGRYEMWKNYGKSTLRNTAGLNTGSELDGRCRLNWYKELFADPIKSIFDVEEFSRSVHHGLSGSHRHIAETMGMIRDKMDVPARNDDGVRFVECKTPTDAVNEVKRCLIEAQMAHAKAISTLTAAELAELDKGLVQTFATTCTNGHTIPNRTYGRRLTNMLEKMDKAAMYTAAEALLPLTNPSLLALLDKLPEDAFPTSMLHGQTVQRISTAAGDIVIGGRENNTYDLDSPDMRDVVCVINLGGNNTYRDGVCDLRRPVLAIIDLHGNDTYVGSKAGIQGGSVLGVSILIDVEGDDKYSAGDVAQGSTIGGAGMLFDFDGKDEYKGLRRVQGHALCGLGILVDRKGDDKYRAALWAQGFGAPGGFGALEDCEGNDHYYCGGLYLDSYPEHPGYDGWGQGVGAGIRQVANGGIGMILDGAGNDNYEVDYFGHGGGYWLGVGVARDFGGNDIRHGTTLSAYTGGPRQQNRWTRFANGFGCHYALGYLFDDEGNDVYGGTIMGTGMAWDLSIGYLCDFNGSDRFTATGGMTQGVGAEGSIGILFSYGGDDEFLGRNQGYASSGISYHSPSNCGGNFSFLINYGGDDKYGSGARNNSYSMRGSQGGFLIDRPTDREAADELEKLAEMIAKREKEIEEYDEMVKKAREEAAEKGRRYVPRTRRPLPISSDQLQRLGSVPHFDSTARTGGSEVNMK